MTSASNQFFRQRRICYWDSEKILLASWKVQFEKSLKFLPELDVYQLKTLDDPAFFPCDLMVVAAQSVPDEELSQWLQGLHNRIKAQGKIWSPALVLSYANFQNLSPLIHEFAANNWYFDIVHPDHFDSLPIRIANLLRIHDHLHELQRYHDQVIDMQERIEQVEASLGQQLKKPSEEKKQSS